MFPPRTTIRSIVVCALACGLLATTTSSAAGRQTDDARTDAANIEQIARAMEEYYSSYGESEPVTAPAAPATNESEPVTAPADDSPWLLISVIAGGLALVLASTALVLRRRRTATV
jgi:hypothetical protein